MDPNTLPFILIPLILIITFGGAFLIASRITRKQTSAWSALAARLGFRLERGNHVWSRPIVTGVLRGHEVKLDTFARSAGNHSETFTRIVIRLKRPAPFKLHLYEEMVIGKIGKFFGAQDIQVGDEALDRRFIIKGEPKESVREFLLGSGLRDMLLSIPSPNISVQNTEVYYEKRGIIMNPEYLSMTFDALTEIAVSVDKLSPGVPDAQYTNGTTAQSFTPTASAQSTQLTPQQIIETFARRKSTRLTTAAVTGAILFLRSCAAPSPNSGHSAFRMSYWSSWRHFASSILPYSGSSSLDAPRATNF